MVNEQVKRVGAAFLVFWTLCGFYLIEFFQTRDLFEYITLLLIGIYVSFSIKSRLKYIWLFILAQNVAEETFLLIGNNSIINYIELIHYPLIVIIGSIFIFKAIVDFSVNRQLS